eukprot:c26271_g1_i1 orf=283-2385(-)
MALLFDSGLLPSIPLHGLHTAIVLGKKRVKLKIAQRLLSCTQQLNQMSGKCDLKRPLGIGVESRLQTWRVQGFCDFAAVSHRVVVVICGGGMPIVLRKERVWNLGDASEGVVQTIEGVDCVSERAEAIICESVDQGGGNDGGSSRRFGGGGGDDNAGRFPQLLKLVQIFWALRFGRFLKRQDRVKFVTCLLFGILCLAQCCLVGNDAIAKPIVSHLQIAGSASHGQENAAKKGTDCGKSNEEGIFDKVWEVTGGQRRWLAVDPEKDEFILGKTDGTREAAQSSGQELSAGRALTWCWNMTRKLMLPEGYPESVTGDYLEYTLWRLVQGVASQINGVLTTQALLFAVGLGKGAIPTAAAVNWVLKDGIGYLSKILLSKYGRHFDVHPKGWRLLADLLENGSSGLELLTPVFPHLFVYLGAAAGAGRSAAGLIQAATRSCFYAGFAAQRNFADVIAKGEAQGMVSKSIGIILGIALSNYVGASGPALGVAFTAVTCVHMFCNLKSYQAVQLRTLNPYRASLVFGEYLRSGVVPSVSEVNAEEPVFSGVPFFTFKLWGSQEESVVLSWQTKKDAAALVKKIELGVTFGNLIQTRQEAEALFKIYESEQYVLSEKKNRILVLLKEGATAHDLLKVMLQASYLYQLETERALLAGKLPADYDSLKLSHDMVQEKYEHVKELLVCAGWVTDGLVSRPKPYRLLDSP